MKVWLVNVKRGADGSKHLDIQMHGVIDGGWMDDDGIDSAACINELSAHLDAKTIGVRINSVGGSAFGGVALYNALQSHPGEVTCTVEGLAASAASLVAMAGKCVMGQGSMMMIHKPATIAMGNADDLRKTADTLDKIQDALAGIYTAKTGKSLEEVNDLLDGETWMSAEEAVSAGFADAVSDHAADGDPEPDPQDPNEGNEDEDGDQPRMVASGDAVTWRGVTFPVAAVPVQMVSHAKPPIVPVVTTTSSTEPEPTAPSTAPVLSVVPPPAPQPPITRAELALRSPELVAALLEEGRLAGVAAERTRLQAIDDLGLKGCVELITAAKYGDQPMTAPELAVAAIKAGHQAGADLLAARRTESRVLAGVVTGAPDQTATAKTASIIQAITDGGNARRGR